MLDVSAPLTPLASFGPYRRRRELDRIVRELQKNSVKPVVAAVLTRRVDAPGLDEPMDRVTESPGPLAVFNQLARLLVPAVCDYATVRLYVGDELARWQECPPEAADVPTSRIDRNGRHWTVTVPTAGHPHAAENPLAGPDYVAALTCGGRGDLPTMGEVALIKLAGRWAAGVVHQARQVELLEARQTQISNLRIAVESNRMIGTAVGVLMAQRQLAYQPAFELLVRTSQASNCKLAVVAETVVYTGMLP